MVVIVLIDGAGGLQRSADHMCSRNAATDILPPLFETSGRGRFRQPPGDSTGGVGRMTRRPSRPACWITGDVAEGEPR